MEECGNLLQRNRQKSSLKHKILHNKDSRLYLSFILLHVSVASSMLYTLVICIRSIWRLYVNRAEHLTRVPCASNMCTIYYSNMCTNINKPLQRGHVGVLAVYNGGDDVPAAQLHRSQRVRWRPQRRRRHPPSPHLPSAGEHVLLQLQHKYW